MITPKRTEPHPITAILLWFYYEQKWFGRIKRQGIKYF